MKRFKRRKEQLKEKSRKKISIKQLFIECIDEELIQGPYKSNQQRYIHE